MICLYPLKKQHDYTELKYSLRSIEMYLKKPYVVLIAGDKLPEWLNPAKIVQIELGDGPRKQENIRNKILASFELTDKVFFFNDDIFLLQETDPETFPYYYSGFLKNTSESGARPLERILNTLEKPLLHYDLHCPILYDKRFLTALKPFGADVIIKSAYGNYLELQGTELIDFKVNRQMTHEQIRQGIKDRPCFSTGPNGLKYALPILEELYPNKSLYEL